MSTGKGLSSPFCGNRGLEMIENAPSTGVVMVDERLLGPQEAAVSVFDASVLHGDSYFETLRVAFGRPRLLGAHLERLLTATSEAGYECVPSTEALRARCLEAIVASRLDDAVLRIVVTRGARPYRMASPSLGATTLVYVLPLPDALRAKPLPAARATLAQWPGYGFPHKSGSYQAHAALVHRARAGQFDEAIVCDGDEVIEAATGNVFAAFDGRYVTPPAARCLPGVTRAALLAVAPSRELEIVERRLTVAELLAADAVFLTNSLVDVRAVMSIDGTAVKEGEAAVRTRALLAALHTHLKDNPR